MHRHWNPRLRDHFYTTHAAGVPASYVYECITCYIYNGPQDGLVPLFCYWSEDAQDHYYTTDDNSTITLRNRDYGRRFTVEYVPTRPNVTPAGYRVVPLCEYWNENNNDHFYTTKKDIPEGYEYQRDVCHMLIEH